MVSGGKEPTLSIADLNESETNPSIMELVKLLLMQNQELKNELTAVNEKLLKLTNSQFGKNSNWNNNKEQFNNSINYPLCKYFIKGKCKYREKCKYQHKKSLCWYYINNRCKFREKCFNLHNGKSRIDRLEAVVEIAEEETVENIVDDTEEEIQPDAQQEPSINPQQAILALADSEEKDNSDKIGNQNDENTVNIDDVEDTIYGFGRDISEDEATPEVCGPKKTPKTDAEEKDLDEKEEDDTLEQDPNEIEFVIDFANAISPASTVDVSDLKTGIVW